MELDSPSTPSFVSDMPTPQVIAPEAAKAEDPLDVPLEAINTALDQVNEDPKEREGSRSHSQIRPATTSPENNRYAEAEE